jgi:hypothetical protein
MTYNDTTLVVVGDSFVYGHLGDDVTEESCHNRSWVRQLEKIGNFKTSVNLGAAGGSNHRSVRVLYEYLEQHYNPDEKYLVIFAATELSRYEMPVNYHLGRRLGIAGWPMCYSDIQDETIAAALGSWQVDIVPSKEMVDFLRMYYASFNDDVYSEKILRNSLFSLKAVLDDLNIESFFTSSIAAPHILHKMSLFGKKLPVIRYFYGVETEENIGHFLQYSGFKKYPCRHYDEDAYKFLADYIYKNYLTKEYHDIQRS